MNKQKLGEFSPSETDYGYSGWIFWCKEYDDYYIISD